MSDKIIAMAKESGLLCMGEQSGFKIWNAKYLSRFRDLVLEEAAKACDDYDCGTDDGRDVGASICAGIIRDMKGEKP